MRAWDRRCVGGLQSKLLVEDNVIDISEIGVAYFVHTAMTCASPVLSSTVLYCTVQSVLILSGRPEALGGDAYDKQVAEASFHRNESRPCGGVMRGSCCTSMRPHETKAASIGGRCHREGHPG